MDALAQMITWMKKRSSTSAQLAKQAEAELAALRERAEKAEAERDALKVKLENAQKTAIYFSKLGHGVRPSLGATRLIKSYEAALKGDA